MPITVDWYLDGRVMKIEMVGAFSVDDLIGAASQAVALVESTDTPLVHCVLDNTHIGDTSASLADINRASQPMLKHERMGWVLVYGNNSQMTRFTGNIVAQISRTRYRMYDTLDDALDFLQKMDKQLPDLGAGK
jgi:hypothetical protein